MSRDAISAVFVAVPIAVLAAVVVTLAMRQEAPPPAGQVTTEDFRLLEARLASRIEQSLAARDRATADVAPAGIGAPTEERIEAVAPDLRATVEDAPASDPLGENAAEEVVAPETDKARRVDALLAKLSTGSVTTEEISGLWDVLSGSGREDEAIKAFQKHAKANPQNPDAHYGLGVALTSKLMTSTSPMDQGILSGRADAAFTKTLELDDDHFGARLSKAISYTFYPSIAGKAPEAIKHFEILRQRHGNDKSNTEMRMVYLNLGNEHLKMGNREKAKAAYREGLATFPDSKSIRAALEAMD